MKLKWMKSQKMGRLWLFHLLLITCHLVSFHYPLETKDSYQWIVRSATKRCYSRQASPGADKDSICKEKARIDID